MRIILRQFNQVLSELAEHFEITTDIFKAERVVLWNDVMPTEKSIVEFAHSLKKPVITIQHGRHGTSRYYPPFSDPIISDKLCVWGERDKEVLVENGHPENKIEVCGSPIFRHLKPRMPHEGVNIIFYPEHWDREVPENKAVAKELRHLKYKNKVQIITKIIDGHNPNDYDNPVLSSRVASNHLDICVDVLTKADIVVGIEEGTFGLLAQAMDIPVVIMEEWSPKACSGDERYKTYWRRISEGSKRTSLKNLNKTILQQLENPEELKETRHIACVEEGGIDIENPIEKISNVIKNAR